MNSKRPTSLGRRPSSPARRKTAGFSALNPSNMDFDVPDWMELSGETAEANRHSRDTAADQNISSPISECTTERTLVEGLKVVCICKGIKKSVFWKALDDGIVTKEEMNHCTGAGSGSCEGRRCGPRILGILRNESL